MNLLLKSFLYNFLHPIKAQEFYYLKRNGLDGEISSSQKAINLRLSEVILFAWLFVFFATLYSILGVKLGISTYIPESLEGIISLKKLGQITILKVLMGFVFFPVGMWTWLKVVGGLMKFSASVIGSDEEIEQGMNDVINGAMTPAILNLLPVIGPGLSNLLFWVYCGIGLNKNLRFSLFQTIVILISPFILFALLISFIVIVAVSSLSFV
ncbi:MAG: hypothetical protein KAG61_09315 [Bacteriovoracaceae bacterium]|nr:hypothetical protein [Bacteriovoracaceae bacterium]